MFLMGCWSDVLSHKYYVGVVHRGKAGCVVVKTCGGMLAILYFFSSCGHRTEEVPLKINKKDGHVKKVSFSC